jgi:hypothetical protein
VHASPKGDTKLKPFGAEWVEAERVVHAAEGATPAFDFVTLKRAA